MAEKTKPRNRGLAKPAQASRRKPSARLSDDALSTLFAPRALSEPVKKILADKAPRKPAKVTASPPQASAPQWPAAMARLVEKSQARLNEFAATQRSKPTTATASAMQGDMFSSFFDLTTHMLADPVKLMQAQVELWDQYLQLWKQTSWGFWGGEKSAALATPLPGDKRFRDPAWDDSPVFNYIKQSYLLTSRWLQSQINTADGLTDRHKKKLDFYTRQFVDAVSPTNFFLTNPQVLRTTLESGGDNLLKGLENLLDDMQKGRLTMTDETAFEVGRDLAITPGAVVFRNALFELIQYSPSTPAVARRPLLVVPPWINKYYILDLKPDNSFLKWAVNEGLTVFVVSWVNPDANLAHMDFGDYMESGMLAAMEAVAVATGEHELNIIGYCLGGTLLASTLAYLEKTDPARAKRVISATFFTTLLDFAEPGELGIFIGDEQLDSLEAEMSERGYLGAREMATAFNLMRANDLIWSFVVNNYLLGKQPFPFDLLYWNGDATRMPAAMHSFYLRNMYQNNLLCRPNGLLLKNVPIDLGAVTTPAYFLSAREDHIAPWTSTYAGTQIFKGPRTFTLAGSGHIAGIVNPPAAKKYQHWTSDQLPGTADEWLAGAETHDGSWWPRWRKWLAQHDGGTVPARTRLGGKKLRPLAPAPGTYVKVKAE